MGMSYEEFIEGFKKYVEDYGYEPDEIRSLNSWVRDYVAWLEFEDEAEEK